MLGNAWKKSNYEVIDVESHGVAYRLHFRNNTTDINILTRPSLFNKNEILALACGREGDSAFVDVGANTGHYSLQLARLGYSKIIAIEPAPVILDALSFNVAANGMQNVITIVPLCIGNGDDVTFYFNDGNWGLSSTVQQTAKPATMKSKPLLDIIQGENVRRIGGMKLDIEGFEDRALSDFFASAPRKLYPKIIVVEHNPAMWKIDIVARMKKLGYRIENRTRSRNLILAL